MAAFNEIELMKPDLRKIAQWFVFYFFWAISPLGAHCRQVGEHAASTSQTRSRGFAMHFPKGPFSKRKARLSEKSPIKKMLLTLKEGS